jgi:hypothetical protein
MEYAGALFLICVLTSGVGFFSGCHLLWLKEPLHKTRGHILEKYIRLRASLESVIADLPAREGRKVSDIAENRDSMFFKE